MYKYYVNNPVIIEENIDKILLLKFIQTDINSMLSNSGINIITPLVINKKEDKMEIIVSSLEQANLENNDNREFSYETKTELSYNNGELENIVKLLTNKEDNFLVEILDDKVVIMR